MKQNKSIRQQPDRYKFLPTRATFYFLDEDTPDCPISFHVVKVQLEDVSYQCFITNLNGDIFAKMTMYNFCSIITSQVEIPKKDQKT